MTEILCRWLNDELGISESAGRPMLRRFVMIHFIINLCQVITSDFPDAGLASSTGVPLLSLFFMYIKLLLAKRIIQNIGYFP